MTCVISEDIVKEHLVDLKTPSAPGPDHQYHLGSSQLMETQEEKDLEVLVTPDLKSSAQVAKAAASANSVLSRIKQTFICLDKEVVLPLYKSVVCP